MSHLSLLSLGLAAISIAGPTSHALADRRTTAPTTELAAAAQQPQQRKPPYEILETPADSKPILEKMEGRQAHVWLDGDVLHMACISTDGPMQVTGGVQQQLDRIPDSDVWVTRLRWTEWPKAFVSYAFIGPTISGKLNMQLWRGDASSQPAPRAAEVGRQETLDIESTFLGETRRVTIVLPPDAPPNIPAIVMADGQGAETWGKITQALAEKGLMRPVAIIGIHNGGYRGDRAQPYDPKLDYRGREYVEGEDPERFAAHLRWVTDEVLPQVAEKFGISIRREDLTVAGFSNGAAFSATAALRRPDVFGAAIVLSVGAPPGGERPPGDLPKFRLAAGLLEPGFNIGTTKVCDTVKAWGADATMQTFYTGHDSAMWELALATYAPELFPPQPS